MPKSRPPYPEQFRRESVQLIRDGRSFPDVAASLGVSQQTLRNWARQDEADRGGARGCAEFRGAGGAAPAAARERPAQAGA